MAELITAGAVCAGVVVNAVIACIALRLQWPYPLDNEHKAILRILAINSDVAMTARAITLKGMEVDPHQADTIFPWKSTREWTAELLAQPEIEGMTRSWRRKLAYLESKGAVATIVVGEIEKGLSKQYGTSDVQYRITHKGWQKIKPWFKEHPQEAEVGP